jgi:hypothetical protein
MTAALLTAMNKLQAALAGVKAKKKPAKRKTVKRKTTAKASTKPVRCANPITKSKVKPKAYYVALAPTFDNPHSAAEYAQKFATHHRIAVRVMSE